MSFLKSLKLKTSTVEIEGSIVTLREMSMAEMARYSHLKRFAPDDALKMMFRACVLEIDGQPVTPEQVEAIENAPARSALPLAKAVDELIEQKDDPAKKD